MQGILKNSHDDLNTPRKISESTGFEIDRHCIFLKRDIHTKIDIEKGNILLKIQCQSQKNRLHPQWEDFSLLMSNNFITTSEMQMKLYLYSLIYLKLSSHTSKATKSRVYWLVLL